MTNPIDLLGVHPAGAIIRNPDPRDYQYGSQEVAGAAVQAPFDWEKGYDVEEDISAVLCATFKFPTKNQGGAGSCGGEAISTLAQAVSAYYLKDTTEKSAKAPYSQVYVPGGGSSDSALATIYKNQGFYKESLVPSYPSPGVPPTEAFMERFQDITAAARLDASKEKLLIAYAFPTLNIDVIAQALASSKGVMLGLYGYNNGTWLTPFPSTAVDGTAWCHWMYGGKAAIVNGQKGIWAKQSWGNEAAPATDNWQFINEEFFTTGQIWGAMVIVVNPAPQALPVHTFAATLKLGETSADVTALQESLAFDGEFNLAPTGYYGPVTAQAVLKFQLKYQLASVAALEELGGDTVGPATIAKLNELFATK